MASEVELLEVFRLGALAGDGEIVRVVGDRLAGAWIARSRFREVEILTGRSLVVQRSAGTLGWRGRAQLVMGRPREAIDLYEERLVLVRRDGDRAGEAATLNNIGGVYVGLGDRARALGYYDEALSIAREVGDRAGEAAEVVPGLVEVRWRSPA
ncbi:MAG: tetratricopeptide repeat protein [Acidimicrobiia bacterium]|nr:tetratricopeptide repeat protein [Acidimicrobiia bacterium]